MKLNRFGEAITWCDKGLAVSFSRNFSLSWVHDLFLAQRYVCPCHATVLKETRPVHCFVKQQK